MDPYQNQRPQQNNTDPNVPKNDPPENPSKNSPESQHQPQYVSGFTMIPPNATRRNNLTTMSQRELQNLQAYRDAQRSAPVHMNPERLGGRGTMDEAREHQEQKQRLSKLQKKLKMEEDKKRQKEEEEKKIQEKKDIQRRKAERLEQNRKQEDELRKKQFAEDHRRVNNDYLQKYKREALASRNASSGINEPVPTTSDVPNVKMSLEEKQLEQKRKNAAFLDRLEHQMKTANKSGESSSSPSQSPPGPVCSGHTAADASEPEFDWALMKLMSNFPHFDKDVLQGFLSQCNVKATSSF
ncbi:epithelial-stromal interaction protein 1 isoform X2 [Boleophthalmus pectinirostris]|uniref:epithelial-stromal interaction protein 1 isoform X2 n=1 Tax=Boleophthalmus pectinirostris TaxID=150288 RepID=UPI00242D96A6|nr:epithelial-stromal interaction protein 1 isoform X2 [Boleophthalmus pectinirostris]